MEYFNVVLKTIIFYVLLILIIRLLGKREVGEIFYITTADVTADKCKVVDIYTIYKNFS